MTSLIGYDIRHRLEEIEDPTLIVWGRNDRVVPVPAALCYKRRIGDNAELEIFDETRPRAADGAAGPVQPAARASSSPSAVAPAR